MQITRHQCEYTYIPVMFLAGLGNLRSHNLTAPSYGDIVTTRNHHISLTIDVSSPSSWLKTAGILY